MTKRSCPAFAASVLFLVVFLGGLLPAKPALAQSLDKKPNILFVLVDNLGYGELGVYGGGPTRGAPTPRIDQLASEDLRLTNMNMKTQCTPSRSSLMTGRFAIRSGTYAVPFGGMPEGLTQWEVTVAESLSAAGYATALHGKWHLGSQDGRLPNDQGFDEWYGIPRTTDESLWSSSTGYSPDIVALDREHIARPPEVFPPAEFYCPPSEYVIVRKLEYYRGGGPEKQLRDIRSMLDTSPELIERAALERQIVARGLQDAWRQVQEDSEHLASHLTGNFASSCSSYSPSRDNRSAPGAATGSGERAAPARPSSRTTPPKCRSSSRANSRQS
jgi:hypothetical protein